MINRTACAIETIEQFFLDRYGHTVTLEYMEGENTILITVECVEGEIASGECDWDAGECLEDALELVLNRAMQP